MVGLLPNPESVLGDSAEVLALAAQHVLPKCRASAFFTLTTILSPQLATWQQAELVCDTDWIYIMVTACIDAGKTAAVLLI